MIFDCIDEYQPQLGDVMVARLDDKGGRYSDWYKLGRKRIYEPRHLASMIIAHLLVAETTLTGERSREE